jgi:hypothetical protein
MLTAARGWERIGVTVAFAASPARPQTAKSNSRGDGRSQSGSLISAADQFAALLVCDRWRLGKRHIIR